MDILILHRYQHFNPPKFLNPLPVRTIYSLVVAVPAPILQWPLDNWFLAKPSHPQSPLSIIQMKMNQSSNYNPTVPQIQCPSQEELSSLERTYLSLDCYLCLTLKLLLSSSSVSSLLCLLVSMPHRIIMYMSVGLQFRGCLYNFVKAVVGWTIEVFVFIYLFMSVCLLSCLPPLDK